MTQNSVIVLGIDSLDIRLVRTWAAQGHLPNFAELLNKSRWGLVENPKGVEAGSVWPTFTTGYRPDHTGLFNACYRIDPSTYKLRVIDIEERSVPPIWVKLSEANKRVAVVDVPYELLEEELNGVQVTDWLPHVFIRYPGPSTYPANLAQELVNKHGGNPFGGPNRCPTNDVTVDTLEEIVDFRDKLLDRIERKHAYCRELLEEERWDYFTAVFHEAHEIGHMCWHVHDKGHEKFDESIATEIGDPILDVYKAIDHAIGDLARMAWDDASVLVYLSHGIGPQQTGTGIFDDILVKLHETYSKANNGAPAAKGGNPRMLSRLAKIYRRLVPKSIRAGAFKTSAAKKLYGQVAQERIRNRAFFACNPNHATGGIRINLKGREEYGVIEPGTEYEQLCKQLASDIQDIVNLDTGEPIVKSAVQINELYDGPRTSYLPDVLLEWNKSGPINRVESPKTGIVERQKFSTRTGDHVQKHGAFLAFGPGITPGELDSPVKAFDFAPTIAHILGVGGAYQGTPIQEICTSSQHADTVAEIG